MNTEKRLDRDNFSWYNGKNKDRIGVNMATIKDIAREAGVSQGTVSNVLNGKGNVSSDKILLVERAAAKLGYTINQRAKTLRKGSSNILAVLLPNLNDQCYVDFFLSFKHYAEAHDYTVSLSISDDIQEKELRQLEVIQAEMVTGLAIFSSLTGDIKGAIKDAGLDESRVVFVERKPLPECKYIGFDYFLAGKKLAEKANDSNLSSIAVITESLNYSDQAEFYEGFLAEFKADDGKSVHHLQTDMVHCYNHYLQMERKIGTPEAVFFSKYELAERFKSMANSLWGDDDPKVYTLSPLFTMPKTCDECYELNYRLMGKTAAEMLINPDSGKYPECTVLYNDGFSHWTKDCTMKSEKKLTVLTLDSPTAHIMEDLARLYSRATGVEVKIAISPYDSIYELLNNMGGLDTYDIIRLDHTWLTGFASKIFAPLEELDPQISEVFKTFIPGLIPNFSTVKGKIYTLPETPSAQLLFYRKDLFESTVIQRLYKERYREGLKPPTNYREFNQIASFFTRQLNPNSPIEYGTTMTLGNSGVSATEFLTRFFSHTQELFDSSGNLLLNTDLALQAMKELVEAKQYSPKKYNNWWRDTAREFAEGNTAMTVLFSNYASEMLNSNSKIIGKIGYAPAPGNNALVGGGCIGVCKNSRSKQEAVDFVKWVCSDKVSTAMTLLGSVSPCKRTYENYEVIDTYPWLTLSKDAINTSVTVRTPGEDDTKFDERRFLSILGMAVNNAYNAAMTEAEALAFAQGIYLRTMK